MFRMGKFYSRGIEHVNRLIWAIWEQSTEYPDGVLVIHAKGVAMKLRSYGKLSLITVAAVLASCSDASAVVPLTSPPIPKRVALADLIVEGKVTAVEDDLVDASAMVKIPGVAQNVSYRVAKVSINSVLLGGKKGDKTVRVGVFQPAAKAGEVRPTRPAKMKFAVDQEGCFILCKHPDEAFYVVQEPYEFLNKAKTADYDKERALVKKCVQLLSESADGLEAKDGEDRLLAAAMQIFRYRTPRVVYANEPKTAPIDAVQSKRILTVLVEADWTEPKTPSAMAPLSLFLYIGLTQKDGWKAPNDLKALPDAAQEWLKKNAGEYRIRRYVPE
jgi:hypothetical protein